MTSTDSLGYLWKGRYCDGPRAISFHSVDTIGYHASKAASKISGKMGFHGSERREASEKGHTIKSVVFNKTRSMSFIT